MKSKVLLYIALSTTVVIVAAYNLQNPKTGQGADTLLSYQIEKNWLHLPDSMELGNPVGLAMDRNQNLVVFHRAGREWPLIGSLPKSKISQNTILVIDSQTGKVLKQWGANLFAMPHGLAIDQDNNVWLTDVSLQQVFKFSPDGNLLMKLGAEGKKGDDSLHFDQPTDVAIDNDGCIYVTDGYGNSRIVKFSREGKYLSQFGTFGKGEGQFNIPHGILCLGNESTLYVADRENERIQVFDSTGKFLRVWANRSFGNFCGLTAMLGTSKIVAVDDHSFLNLYHRGSDVYVFNELGEVQSRFGRSGKISVDRGWYHDLAVDANGNIYVGDFLNNQVLKFVKRQ